MKNFSVLMLIFMILLSCSENDGNGVVSSENKQQAAIRVDSANTALADVLNNMMQNSDQMSPGDIPDYTDVSAAHALFLEALEKDPDNKDAHLGVALTDVMMMTQSETMDSLFEAWEDMMEEGNDAFAKTTLNKMRPKLSSKLYKYNYDIERLIDAYITIPQKAFQDPMTFSSVQEMLEEELIPTLEESIGHLEVVLSDPDYTFMVSPALRGEDNSDSLEIDLTEVYLLKAGLHALHSLSNISIAYTVDLPVEPTQDELMDALAQDSDFLTLRDGKAPMQTARTSIFSTTEAISNSMDFLMNEQDNQSNDFIPQDSLTAENQAAIESSIDQINLYLEIQQEYAYDLDGDGDEETIMIDAKQIFDNPAQDLKQLLPAYTISDTTITNDYGTQTGLVLIWEADTYQEWTFPNPTFNGFLPNMTSSEFKTMLGIDESSWTKNVFLMSLLNDDFL